MPDPLSSAIANSLGDIPDDLALAMIKEFKTGRLMECVKAEANHRSISKQNHNQEHKSIDGVGRLRLRVDPYFFHDAGRKYGYACWGDNGFKRDVEKRYPEMKVKCGGTKIQVGFGSCGEKRSSTVYNL